MSMNKPNEGGETLAEKWSEVAQPGRIASSWHAAERGFGLASRIFAPCCAIPLILGLTITAFGAGSGKGFAIHPWLPAAIVVCLGFSLAGALLGLLFSLIRRVRTGLQTVTWWRPLNRPIHRSPILAPKSSLFDSTHEVHGFWRGFFSVIAVVGLIATVLGFAFGIYARLLVDRRLAEAVASANRDDPNWRLDDLIAHRDRVSEAENSAIIVAKASDRLPENWPDIASKFPNSPPQLPTEAGKAYRRLTELPGNVRLDEATVSTLRDELSRHQEAVRIARTVAGYPRGTHALVIGPGVFDTPLKETQSCRAVGRLLAADAAIRAQDGDIDGALESCRALLCVARSIGDEPFSISQLFRVAVGGDALRSIRRVLGQGEPSEVALARVQALLSDERSQPLLLIGLKGERAAASELMRRIGAGDLPIEALSANLPKSRGDGPPYSESPWLKLMFENQQALVLDWFNTAVTIARQPNVGQLSRWNNWKAEIDRAENSRIRLSREYGDPHEKIRRAATPPMSAVGNAHYRYESDLGAMILLLAMERHRRKTGTWAESLAVIDRTILPESPTDSLSGHDYLMERKGGEWIVFTFVPERNRGEGEMRLKLKLKPHSEEFQYKLWDVPLRGQPAASVPSSK